MATVSNQKPNKKNENENTNNEAETEEDKALEVLNLNRSRPEILPYGVSGVPSHISKSYMRLQTRTFAPYSLESVKKFFHDFNICLLATDGREVKEWSKNDTFEIGISGTKCTFLGTEKSSLSRCKMKAVSQKLLDYLKFMIDWLLFYFTYRIPADKQKDILGDEETMNTFGATVRNLFYFYGQNQIDPPLKGANLLFMSLINGVNGIFKTKVIRILCKAEEYGCGRYIGVRKCNTSPNYFIYIYKTGGENNISIAETAGEDLNAEAKTCGGSRTRKQERRKKLKRKTRSRK